MKSGHTGIEWNTYMVTDKYGNRMHLGWSESSLEVFEALWPFRMDEYCFNQLNERASTIEDKTGAIGLVSEPHLKFQMIVRVRIECHR